MRPRVLFTTTGGLGHVLPSVALARASAARGHDVLWAVPPEGLGPVRRAGIEAVAIGTAGLTHPADARRLYPEIDSLPPDELRAALFGKLFGAPWPRRCCWPTWCRSPSTGDPTW